MAPSRVSTHAFQALISGRVIDDRTGAAPATAVSLVLNGTNGDWTPENLRLALRQLDGGEFAFFGNPQAAFPDKTITYQLRLTARAAGYPDKVTDFAIGPLGSQPQEVIFNPPLAAIGPIPAVLFRGGGLPKQDLLIQLTLAPVTLAGEVLGAESPPVSLGGAEVKVKQAYHIKTGAISNVNGLNAVTTASGGFSLVLPVAQAVVIEIKKLPKYKAQTFTVSIDYANPVNRVKFSVVPGS